MLQQQGDAEGARAAYQRVIDSDDADAAPKAAFNLGVVLEKLGNEQGARAASRQVIDFGPVDAAEEALQHLEAGHDSDRA